MTDRSRFSIIPIGSLHTGWALKVDADQVRDKRLRVAAVDPCIIAVDVRPQTL